MCDTDNFIIDSKLRDAFIIQFADYFKVILLALSASETVEQFEKIMSDCTKDVNESFEKEKTQDAIFSVSDEAIATQGVIDISCFLTPLVTSFFKYDCVQITEAALLDMYDNFINA